jgi:hypothetical protein
MVTQVVISDSIEQIWTHKDAENASIALEATDRTHEDLAVLAQFIKAHGACLLSLNASLQDFVAPYHHDWKDINFIEACPHLTSLTLARLDVTDSVLLHPTIQNLTLTTLHIYADKHISLPHALEKVMLEDVNVFLENTAENADWARNPAIFAESPNLKVFEYYLDEDYVESTPDKFYFENCPQLESVVLSIDGGGWDVQLKGLFPKAKFGARSGRFGQHGIDVSQIANGSHPNLIKLREGDGHLSGEVIALIHNSKHFIVEKAQQAIRLLGGKIAESVDDPDVTIIVIGDKEYKDWDETPYEHLEIVLESEFRDADIEAWY